MLVAVPGDVAQPCARIEIERDSCKDEHEAHEVGEPVATGDGSHVPWTIQPARQHEVALSRPPRQLASSRSSSGPDHVSYRILVTDDIDPDGVALLRAEPSFIVDEVPTLPPTELVRKFVNERGQAKAQLDCVCFLDGDERVGKASFRTEETFITTVERPGLILFPSSAAK